MNGYGTICENSEASVILEYVYIYNIGIYVHDMLRNYHSLLCLS